MCHPARGPAHAPAPYPRELVRVRRVRDLIDRTHDAAAQHTLDVATLACREGVTEEGLSAEFARAFGISLHAYIAARDVWDSHVGRSGLAGAGSPGSSGQPRA